MGEPDLFTVPPLATLEADNNVSWSDLKDRSCSICYGYSSHRKKVCVSGVGWRKGDTANIIL